MLQPLNTISSVNLLFNVSKFFFIVNLVFALPDLKWECIKILRSKSMVKSPHFDGKILK